MAFWWYRRNRWYQPRRRRYRRRKYYKRKPRRRLYRRRNRTTTRRRRRRRRTKVKKKKKFLRLLQWQPDSIRKCKIKTIDTLLLGANGTQYRNFTTHVNDWTTEKTPGGGGFSTTKFSLSYLYEQHTLGKNIWTTSNINYDLCRYTGCKFIFYKHPWMDFVVEYQLQYPMTLNLGDYYNTHPLSLLLSKHKIIIPSIKHNPFGKRYVKKKIAPPKQMTNKWFFQDSFADKPLVLLRAAVCDLAQPQLGPSGENTLVTLICLNIHSCYDRGDWGGTDYKPYSTWSGNTVNYTDQRGTSKTESVKSDQQTYSAGWFTKQLLQARTIDFTTSKKVPPVYYARYNPNIDDGIGNTVYLCSVSTSDFNKPASDKTIIASNKPLWKLLFGFIDYIVQIKKPAETLSIYYLVIESKYIHGTPDGTRKTLHIPLDMSFIQGKGPYNSLAPDSWLNRWYPTLLQQQNSINHIVKSGPFVPKPDPTKANWELHYNSTFFFKWGGAQDQTKQITDPSKQADWITPDSIQQTLQAVDPKSQIPQSILHSWDFRRGEVTETALKRMYEHLPTETLIPTDSEEGPLHKKARYTSQLPALQEEEKEETTCLLSLCEEPTWQDQETQNLQTIQHLIQQQQQQQHNIKLNLLKLLSKLKRSQMNLQLHSGLLE
nr:MAG: ORF1 [Torque teno midi virus]